MPVMPMPIIAFFSASKRDSLQIISTLVILGIPSVKAGTFLTGMASASGVSPRDSNNGFGNGEGSVLIHSGNKVGIGAGQAMLGAVQTGQFFFRVTRRPMALLDDGEGNDHHDGSISSNGDKAQQLQTGLMEIARVEQATQTSGSIGGWPAEPTAMVPQMPFAM